MLLLLDLVPRWVWMALVAMFAATSCTLKIENGTLSLEIEKHATRIAELKAGIQASNANAAEQAARFTQQARKAEQARAAREQALLDDAAGARNELERLRTTVSAYRAPHGLRAPTGAITTGTEYTDPIPELFIACTERYIELARVADGHANDAQALIDAWPVQPNTKE